MSFKGKAADSSRVVYVLLPFRLARPPTSLNGRTARGVRAATLCSKKKRQWQEWQVVGRCALAGRCEEGAGLQNMVGKQDGCLPGYPRVARLGGGGRRCCVGKRQKLRDTADRGSLARAAQQSSDTAHANALHPSRHEASRQDSAENAASSSRPEGAGIAALQAAPAGMLRSGGTPQCAGLQGTGAAKRSRSSRQIPTEQ